MGITIHYRGTMDYIGQIESLEDRVLDFVYSMGGRATIWRSFDDHDSSRVVRGLMIELEPGHDTFSLSAELCAQLGALLATIHELAEVAWSATNE